MHAVLKMGQLQRSVVPFQSERMLLESGKLRPTLGVHFREVSIVKSCSLLELTVYLYDSHSYINM